MCLFQDLSHLWKYRDLPKVGVYVRWVGYLRYWTDERMFVAAGIFTLQDAGADNIVYSNAPVPHGSV